MQLSPFTVTLAPPLQTATGQIAHRRGFMIRRRIGGVDGVGEATPLSGWTESHAACADALRSAARGESIDPVETPAAHHAVELAGVVAEARSAGVPLARQLDGPPDASVAVNATVGLTDAQTVATCVSKAVDAGYQTVKLKLAGTAADIERLAAASDAAGDARIRGDCNGRADPQTARRICAAAADLDIEFIEQPLPGAYLDGLTELVETGCPIAIDEGLRRHDITTLADAGVAVIICKPMALGGPLRTLDLVAAADTAGLSSVITTTYDAVIARTAAVHVAAAVGGSHAHGVATASRIQRDTAQDPLDVTAGAIAIGSTPGLSGLTDAAYDLGP